MVRGVVMRRGVCRKRSGLAAMGVVSPHIEHEVILPIHNLKVSKARLHHGSNLCQQEGMSYKKKGRVYYDAPSPQATSDAQAQWVSANFHAHR